MAPYLIDTRLCFQQSLSVFNSFRMSDILIKPVIPLKKFLKPYVKFGIELYKGNPCFVPPLILDEINTLLPQENPAFDFCRAQSFMAYRDGKPVGRITGIINDAYNRKVNRKILRFGFVDFINDDSVVDALFQAVATWGKKHGMTEIVGPMGFSDMDREGMLIEGFDEMGTMATIYNFPYYKDQMVRMGFVKEADWIEFRMTVPDSVPEKYQRIADIVARRFGLRRFESKSRKVLKEKYGRAIFELINDAYKDLYGYVALSTRQVEYYIDMYLGLLRLDDLCLIVDSDDKLVGVGISMPSLSQALRKSSGKLFPTGWFHLLKAIRGGSDVVDLLLVAVAPEFQSKGVNAMIFASLIPAYIKNGYKFAESNVELETNSNVQKQWEYFEYRQHRRRRSWRKNL